jgi:hypothetical protein
LPLLNTEDPKDIRETGKVPRADEQIPNYTTHKLREGAGEENVIIIFYLPA